MKKSMTGYGSRATALKAGASIAVLGALMLSAMPAYAQDAAGDDEAEVSDVIVTGTRAALRSAQNIKRDADTVVDSITATDIGAFPDKSVAEALQRVAGITVNRFAASSDTAHFSAEPSGVIVRGLQQVRTEFNGRDSFSANSGRGLSFADVSPELMAGVDTYKNQTADLIEGGIAGTINLRTRVPFDSTGQLLAISANVNYGDISEKYTPEISGIWSNRWETSFGEFGAMVNIAHSEVQTRSQAVQFGRMGIYENVYSQTPAGAEPTPGAGLNYLPSFVGYSDTTYDRTRDGVALAGQWQDLDHRFLLTAQYQNSKYVNEWHENGVQTYPGDLFYGQNSAFHYTAAGTAPRPAPGTEFTFDNNGYFQSGVVVQDIGWWGASDAESGLVAQNSSGQQLVNACYSWNGCTNAPSRGSNFSTVSRFNHNENVTEDLSLNLKWEISDRMRANFDVQTVHSEITNYDMNATLNSFANSGIDMTQGVPRVTLSEPTNVNLDEGGTATASNYWINSLMDHIEDSEGDELALRADLAYDFGTDWLDSIRFGVRYADRDQTVRWSAYNWQNVANLWTQNAAYFNVTRGAETAADCAQRKTVNANYVCTGFKGYPTGITETKAFGDQIFDGGLLSPTQFVFFNMDLVEDRARMAETMNATALGLPNGAGWDPICSNTGDRAQEIPGTCYRQVELAEISEETEAAYVMLKFGGDNALIGGIPVSGNIGVRYVKTNIESAGAIQYPNPFDALTLACTPTPAPQPGQPAPEVEGSIGCYLSPDEIAFNSGGGVLSTAEAEQEHWLPSFNVKFDLTDQWVLRFAASRAMARPEIGYLKNFVQIGAGLPSTQNADDDRWIKNSAGDVIGVAPNYTASAYNPYLEPTTANQYDLALEWYFDDVGSFTITAFKKDFQNYIQYGQFNLDVTNNGVTREVEVRGPINGDGAGLQGFEVAYQQYFDFLPAPFDGLGVQANYTYVENQGITNSNSPIVSSDGGSGTTNAGNSTLLNTGSLEGLSEHSYNVVAMYEKGPWALRAAYNWRSEYLVTAFDCCVYLPVWQDAVGYLDASVRYRINDRFELSLQGSNLLDTEATLKQQVTDVSEGRQLLPNAWLRQDRRLTLGLRFRY
ncbi:hypothetical protein ASG17_12285 [Brevundimonas sp. Leaf363]|uniref:TonB-dependent receptor n=1 Tax=Brevundimonas sp. Leaf363 TaxID=1736353 RepID=UPI0006FA0B14|nr:TonB-dependent receptor [Brevundimonas sp. Leaf363]KQS54402.1 hypothetical protein ASG17_12285 [Brevundimonas sp. Leaf363]